MLVAAGAFAWFYLGSRGNQAKGPDLVRVSPDDGHSYSEPAISPDGGFVAYISDRSGKKELWLQQVGGGDPIQLTHSDEKVKSPAFFPDGRRILYERTSADGTKSTIEAISTLGGEPQVLIQGGRIPAVVLSPDGRQIAYPEFSHGVAPRLVTISSNGGRPRELPAWARMPKLLSAMPVWTSDSRYLLCWMKPRAGEWKWFAFPADGGNQVATGAGAALRVAGLNVAPRLMTGDRVLFNGGRSVWEIRLSPSSWRVQGVPHQLASGTLDESPCSVSATGTVALQVVGSYLNNLYLIPLSAATGQPTGVVRRLTQDGRQKLLARARFPWNPGGDPGSAYFMPAGSGVYAVDLASSKQTLVIARLPPIVFPAISPDGRQVAYSVAEGDSYSIRLSESGEAGGGPEEARVLCKACGRVQGFSPDGRFLFYCPECKVKHDPKRKTTVRLLEVASGKDWPWLEHPTDSVSVDGRTFGQDSGWLYMDLKPPGSGASRGYLVPWREEPVPQSEWIEIPGFGPTSTPQWEASPTGNFYYFFEGSKLMAVAFDSRRKSFSEPHEVVFVPGSAVTLKPDDDWTVRGPGLVFSRQETGNSSVWLMKLPR